MQVSIRGQEKQPDPAAALIRELYHSSSVFRALSPLPWYLFGHPVSPSQSLRINTPRSHCFRTRGQCCCCCAPPVFVFTSDYRREHRAKPQSQSSSRSVCRAGRGEGPPGSLGGIALIPSRRFGTAYSEKYSNNGW